MNLDRIKSILAEGLGDEFVIDNADMGNYCSFKCGGKAKLLVEARDMDALRYSLYVIAGADKLYPSCGSCSGNKCGACNKSASCSGCGKVGGDSDSAVPYMIIGNGSNLLVKDGGYDGIIIKLGNGFSDISFDGNTVTAGAAALLSSVSRAAAERGLTGLEFASGIPGSLGGGVFMNAGAYGGELKNVVKSVKAISKDGIREYILDADKLELSYRHSIFEDTGDIITQVKLELCEGNKEEITARMDELSQKRNAKQPLRYPSAGSFFKRPEGHFAGQLIEEAGLKGLSVGGAQVSELHAGFIINKGGATAGDVVNLMNLVRNIVMDKSGVMLEPEVRIIGSDAL